MKVFLGGTCNESTWRNELIPMLDKFGIEYFNPVVDDWTPECQEEERVQKNLLCDVHLYVITPRLTGFFSIAEIIESSFNQHKTTLVYIMDEDNVTYAEQGIRKPGIAETKVWTIPQKKSLVAVSEMAEHHGAIICYSLEHIVKELEEVKKFQNNMKQILHKRDFSTPQHNLQKEVK